LTGDQHTDHISNGQQVSRHSLPTLLYFLFFPPHFFFIQFFANRTVKHIWFLPTHNQTLKNQKSLPLPTAPIQNDYLNAHLVRYLIFILSFANYKQVQ
jgi:hypothetical protein